MCYKRHQNLQELLLADAQAKLMHRVVEKDEQEPCNCPATHVVNGQRLFGEDCQKSGVIYKVTCKCCGAYYIGKTMRELKIRIYEHIRGTKNYWNKKDTFEKEMRRTELALPVKPPDPSSNSL